MIGTKVSLLLSVFFTTSLGFGVVHGGKRTLSKTSSISMEYIPEGLTKEQWKAIQEKEKQSKNLGVLGTTRFKSRSFEAWQKAGAKHLFPVDPTVTPYQERPYMQRKDGDWEGKDLKNLGLQGQGQGVASSRNNLDNLYEKAKAEGKLNSVSIFGGGSGLPWTGQQANDDSFNPDKMKGSKAVSTKKLSPEELAKLKANLAKVSNKQANAAAATSVEAPKKKGLFGMF
eukprot:gene5694-11483_t